MLLACLPFFFTSASMLLHNTSWGDPEARHFQRMTAEVVGGLVPGGGAGYGGKTCGKGKECFSFFGTREAMGGWDKGWAQDGLFAIPGGFSSFWHTRTLMLPSAGTTCVPLASFVCSQGGGQQLRCITGGGVPPKVGVSYPAKPLFASTIHSSLL